MQHVKAFHPLVSGHNIGRGISFQMADMKSLSAGVGEHIEHVKFRFRRVEPWFMRVRRMKGIAFPAKAAAISARIPERETVFVARSLVLSSANPQIWLPFPRLGLSAGVNNLDGGGNFEVVTLRCKHF